MRPEGQTLNEIVAHQIRDMRVASRKLGGRIKNVAVKAVRESARAQLGGLRFGPTRLNVKGKSHARAELVAVDVYGTPVGFWSIIESGAAPHQIRPRHKKVLAFDDVFTQRVNHPGTGGRRVWSNTETPLRAAIEPVIEAGYDAALEGR